MANVLITGTSKGIGLAGALVLARAGHTVFATMRNPSKSPELSKITKEESLPVFIYQMDVDDDASVANTIAAIQKEKGPIDVLINNAGIETRGSIEELDLSVFKAIMETNYFGVIRCVKAVVSDMRKRQSGCIINVSSVAGRIANSPLGPYSASKFALESISEAMAQELKPFNIRVNIVEPGIIETDMAQRIADPAPYSIYPNSKRFEGLFSASLKNPTSPFLVGEKFLEIVDSGTWKLRHPVGPDAIPFLEWRAAMGDEEWIDWNAVPDEVWYQRVQDSFGLDARPKEKATQK